MFTLVIIALIPTILMLTAIFISAWISRYNVETVICLVGITILTAFFGVLAICVSVMDLFGIDIVSTNFRNCSIVLTLLTLAVVFVTSFKANFHMNN